MTIRAPATTFLLLLLCALAASAQGVRSVETAVPAPTDSVVMLGHEFVVPGSLRVSLDSAAILSGPEGYTLDARAGLLRLGPGVRAMLADTSRPHRILLEYSYRPLLFDRDYARRRLVTVTDSGGTTRTVAQRSSELTAADIFGKNFQRSGSIVRGFTVGSNRDLTLQSGLRLQFSGNVTDDVEVLGALTDEQTPIQPEGNTQTLREVDNIFVEIRSPYAGATLGKFVAANPTGYAAYSRKLQGVKAIARYGGFGSTEVVAAVAPGRFRTQVVGGRERDQGPYRLTGQNGERNIVVVAGTERVFIDGVVMVRGESNDYVIDYSTAEVFFQTRRPITSESRITVEFEYADRRYSRSFVAVNNTGRFADSAVTIGIGYVREADNPDATIDITLSDADRRLLAAAGADGTRAVRSGAYEVGRTDSTVGSYVRIDTTINGLPDSVFRYDPANPAAVYNVIFSVPPDGRGDYRYVAFGEYEFAGKGAGSYMPVIYLPLPELRQVVSFNVRAAPTSWAALDAEAAYSDVLLNRFSADPAARRQGTALSLALSARRDTLRLPGLDVARLRVGARVQYVAAGFQSVERIGDVEFGNRWNASARPGESVGENLIVEDTVIFAPWRRLELSAMNGYLRQGRDFSSLRGEYTARFLGDTLLPSADYTYELIGTDTLDGVGAGGRTGSWLRQRGGVSYPFGPLVPAVRFETERREDRAGADTLAPTSYRFVEAGPEATLTLPFMSATARARFRMEDSARFVPGESIERFVPDGRAQTYALRGELRGVRDLTSTIDITYRRRTYDSVPGADPTRRLNNVTLLARSQTRYSAFDRGLDLDALYEVQTEQAARLQRLFVRVPYGRGDYSWADLNADGVQTEDEFRIAIAGEGEYVRVDLPTEQLYPVIDLRTSVRLRLQPRRFLNAATTLGRLLGPVTTETTLRLEEKSQDERESDIYLLRFSAFQNDSTTIVGNATVGQDVNLFETNPEYSFRLRYLGRYGLVRLVTTVERSENVERSLRIRWQPTYELGLQLDLAANRGLLRSSDSGSSRPFDLTSMNAANDFSYRPEQSLELGWMLRLVSTRDVLPIVPRTTSLNTNALRAVYSIETRGRLRIEVERTNVSGRNIGGDALSLPYQLTDGYEIGTTWIGRATFEYRFGANIQASITYTGRAQPPSMRVVHVGQAEVRAFF